MELSRRGFLGSLVGGVAAAAAVRTWPFRVYSFPADIVPVRTPWPDSLTKEELDRLNEITIKYFNPVMRDQLFRPSPLFEHLTRNGKLDPYGLCRG
jgi:hypothetical protein